MNFKIVMLIFVAIILYCLGSALVSLIRDGANSERMIKALTWRVILSVALFALLFVAYALGWIHPHSL